VWIRKAQAGDARAFQRLVELHAPVIWGVVHRTAPRGIAPEDLFQETVIRFWKGLPSFQGDSKLSTWLYSVAYRVCLDHIEKVDRRGEQDSLEARREAGTADPEDEFTGGSRIVSRIEARDAVEKALEALDPEWRAMVTFHYWQGLGIEEIAEITGRPANTVKVYLHRARAKLREVLEAGNWPEEA
jgi:RNA polymerase sigma-70 factor (ECF subfamily)